jgi:hypothetical protein
MELPVCFQRQALDAPKLTMLRRLVLIIAPFVIFCAIITTAGVNEWRRSAWEAKYRPVDLARLGYFISVPAQTSLSDVPSEFRKLNGRHVRLEGQIRGACSDGTGLYEFELFGQVHPGTRRCRRITSW